MFFDMRTEVYDYFRYNKDYKGKNRRIVDWYKKSTQYKSEVHSDNPFVRYNHLFLQIGIFIFAFP